MEQKDIDSYMLIAYLEALKALKENETPIGAVLVDIRSNSIIATSYNHSLKEVDPTLHAEMNVLKKGFNKLKTKNLSSCALFITLEPCLMCLGGIINSHLKEVYFGALDPKKGAFTHYNVDINIDNLQVHYLDIKKDGELLSDFFKKIRSKS